MYSSEFKRRYYRKLFGEKFNIEYGLCVNGYLKNLLHKKTQKRQIYLDNFMEDGIDLLFGDDDNYFETLDAWINK